MEFSIYYFWIPLEIVHNNPHLSVIIKEYYKEDSLLLLFVCCVLFFIMFCFTVQKLKFSFIELNVRDLQG